MKKIIVSLLMMVSLVYGCGSSGHEVIQNDLRAPAYPLVTIDPYTSAWSFGDKLYEGSLKHWTGKDFPLLGVIRVDGENYRFMGLEDIPLLTVFNTSEQGMWTGKYTFTRPREGWNNKDFNDKQWKEGPAAFGTRDESTVKTAWETEEIWVRREINLEEDLSGKKVFLEYSHDDDFELYINGIEVVNTGYKWRKNVTEPVTGEALASLKKGKNVIAAHCTNRSHGALVDFGLFTEQSMPVKLERTAEQKSVNVQATQTHYTFTCGGVDLKLSFAAPLFMEQLDLLSRPVNYLSYEVVSNDGKEHEVDVYFESSPNWALNHPGQASVSESFENGGLVFLKTGSKEQNYLGKKGDDVRIDWGYFYMAAKKENTSYLVGNAADLRKNFVDKAANASSVKKENARMALIQSLGKIKKGSGKIMIGYDDIYSIQYFGVNLRPYWNRSGDQDILMQFQAADREYQQLIDRCYRFDQQLMEKATLAGGKKYAELCVLAYRQAIAAHKLVEAPNGDLLFLSKENFSNGSIGTVDITYPSAPLFLLYNVELVKGLMNHIFYYSESGKWTKPFAAHDVGTYPMANGQTYGGDMPVEESGNMLILTAAVAAVEGNAKYAEKHWDVLTVWTDYLVENGLDPENQLCTDDFAGHFAHNVNLSAKAIMGIASYGKLAAMLGKKDISEKYTQKAKEMAKEWMRMADDGDHYRLTFDQPGTWSQKYNLVWNKLMNMGIFPEEVAAKEIAYYQTKQNKYGLPLDNRKTYTKADWIIWTATLANDKETFQKFIDPLYLFMNETTDRIPMSDWYYTDKPKHTGFRARAVVGGYFIKMLEGEMK
ncbi:MAG: DUF4965 domain-containing protein [Bacteroidales bacterium]|jgi:hypothetical protein|nr:DUF4965 domain-containing protein [Bacteroidales bacterium]